MNTFCKSGVLLTLLILICFSSCAIQSKADSEFFAMDTIMTITAFGNNSKEAVNKAEKEINRLDVLLSVQNKNSEVYRLNLDKTISASDDTLSLIINSIEYNELTDGAFDITTEPLTHAWGFYSDIENRVPDSDEIDGILKTVGLEHIDVSDNIVTLDDKTAIDLGGVAKGYASARAAEALTENGVSSALISLGGNVRTIGSKPDGSKWNIGIVNPDDNSKQIGYIAVSDSAVVTSGGYQRFFEQDGKVYHHIIDPQSGYPANNGLKSVTVVSDDDCLADALSTALFVMGTDKASEFYSKHSSEFGAVFVTEKNDIYITDNLTDKFSSQQSFEVIKS